MNTVDYCVGNLIIEIFDRNTSYDYGMRLYLYYKKFSELLRRYQKKSLKDIFADLNKKAESFPVLFKVIISFLASILASLLASCIYDGYKGYMMEKKEKAYENNNENVIILLEENENYTISLSGNKIIIEK